VVRELLDERIFQDMGGKNPNERVEEAKREYETAIFIHEEESKQLDEMQRKFESIQVTLTRLIKGYCRDPNQFPPEARDRIIKRWDISWRDFKKCAKNYCETGEMDLTIISTTLVGSEVV
jgi:hypothetical protein